MTESFLKRNFKLFEINLKIHSLMEAMKHLIVTFGVI